MANKIRLFPAFENTLIGKQKGKYMANTDFVNTKVNEGKLSTETDPWMSMSKKVKNLI